MKKYPEKIFDQIDPELRGQVKLSGPEVSARISRLMLWPADAIAKIVSNPSMCSTLDYILAKVIIHAMKTDKPNEAVGCVEWLMQRSVGKVTEQINVNEVSKVTYITSIEKSGEIKQQKIEGEDCAS